MAAISIIIPVYKAEKYISRCIESIKSQTFQDWELILVDDGSPDHSGDICDQYQLEDKRIKVFHKKNGGVSSARNLALEHVSSKYVTFVDSDDWIESSCLASCLNEVEESNLDLLQFGFNRVNETGAIISVQELGTDVLRMEDYLNEGKFNLCAAGSILKTKMIKDNNIKFLESIKYAEDQLFMYNYFLFTNRCKSIKHCYYSYFDNDCSATKSFQRSEDLMASIKQLSIISSKSVFFEKYTQRQIQIFLQRILLNHDQNCCCYTNLFKCYYNQRYKAFGSLDLYNKILTLSPQIAYNLYGKLYSICHRKY